MQCFVVIVVPVRDLSAVVDTLASAQFDYAHCKGSAQVATRTDGNALPHAMFRRYGARCSSH